MQPVQITIRDIPGSLALEDHIRKKADKLSQYYQRINSCRIVITLPQKHKHNGKLFCVAIDLTVPGKELVTNRKLDQDVYVAIRDAFNAAKRQLECYADKRRGDVKKHVVENRGFIKRIYLDNGYGFIEDSTGTEIYFSHDNLLNGDFDQLKMGDKVEFYVTTADDGMRAHHIVKIKNHE